MENQYSIWHYLFRNPAGAAMLITVGAMAAAGAYAIIAGKRYEPPAQVTSYQESEVQPDVKVKPTQVRYSELSDLVNRR